MKNREQYNNARAAIAAVNLGRLGALCGGVWYLFHLDWLGVGLMVVCFLALAIFLPVTGR